MIGRPRGMSVICGFVLVGRHVASELEKGSLNYCMERRPNLSYIRPQLEGSGRCQCHGVLVAL
jgi:hypothetical protein